MFPKLDIIGHFPPWWDWAVWCLSVAGLLYVLIAGLYAMYQHSKGNQNNWQLHQRGLHPQVTGLVLFLGLILFWLSPERGSWHYVLMLATLFVAALTVTVRLFLQVKHNS